MLHREGGHIPPQGRKDYSISIGEVDQVLSQKPLAALAQRVCWTLGFPFYYRANTDLPQLMYHNMVLNLVLFSSGKYRPMNDGVP